MGSVKQLELSYSVDRDILVVHLLPHRPARMGGGEYGCLIGYAEDNSNEIVSLEILDFADFIPHLYEPGVLPILPLRFNVQELEVRVDPDGTIHRRTTDTGLHGVTLHEALEWAYHTYILAHFPRRAAVSAEAAT